MSTEEHDSGVPSISLDEVFGPDPVPETRPEPGLGRAPRLDTEFGVGGALAAQSVQREDIERADAADETDDGDEEPTPLNNELRTIVEWVAVVVVAISVALLIKEFVFQAFEIPSGSMQPTVVPGDRILVNKLSYTFGDIERGDLLVFDRLEGTPGDTDQLIKRAIGLPGETLEIRDDGRLWIWGAAETAEDAVRLDETYLDPTVATFQVPTLTSTVTSDLWNQNCLNQPRTPGRCTLGDSDYLVLGDNRVSSTDSRWFGPIPEENVLGRAVLRIWPPSDIGGL